MLFSPDVLRSALLGTDRSPVPAAALERLQALGLTISDDPAQAAWEVLLAQLLMQRAGFALADAPAIQLPAAEKEEEMPCPPAAAKMLEQILFGQYGEALGAFISLLAQHKCSLPTEFLPQILDRSVKYPAFWAAIRPILGARAKWLAAQNPDWQPLFVVPTEDWSLASFPERLALLRNARQNAPQQATIWLESTWKEERSEHKAAFLAQLRPGLSLADEPLLERAATAKSREERWLALRLLGLIDSQRRQALAAFFTEKLSKAFDSADFLLHLKEQMPDLSAEPEHWLAALLPGKAIGEDWRLGAVGLVFGLLPPEIILNATGKTLPRMLQSLDEPGAKQFLLPKFLEGIAHAKSDELMVVTLQVLAKSPHHDLWKSPEVLQLLAELSPDIWASTMTDLCRREQFWSSPEQVVVRSLLQRDVDWPKNLLDTVLLQIYTIIKERMSWEMPAKLFRILVEKAAYRCRTEDGEAAAGWLLATLENRHPFQREFEQFGEVIRFRRKMESAFS